MDSTSLTDAFVEIKMDNDTLIATQVIIDSLDPEFDETYRLDICHRIENVVFAVYDKNIVSNEKIGVVSFKANDLLYGVERKQDGGYPIESRTRSQSGRLFLSIRFISCTEIEKESYDTDGYFDTKENCRMNLYQDAHVPENIHLVEHSGNTKDMQEVSANSCWNDLYGALVEAKDLICITGWSIWTELKLLRGNDAHIEDRSLGEILVDKANEGVNVYVMIWDEADSVQTIYGMGTHDEDTHAYFEHTST